MLPIKIKEWQLLLLLACIQFSNILDFVIMMPLAQGLQEFWELSSLTDLIVDLRLIPVMRDLP